MKYGLQLCPVIGSVGETTNKMPTFARNNFYSKSADEGAKNIHSGHRIFLR